MIIKEFNDRAADVTALERLLSDATMRARPEIERNIKTIRSGVRGEKEAAYEMQVHYGTSPNWMILHDLRIEHGGDVAQIDHLLINRLLEFWVCESKAFAQGVSVNDHGEFIAFYGNRRYGVASPIEQNARHIKILERLLNSGAIALPRRLGLTIRPALKSLILVSRGARIVRPKARVDGIDQIIKNDQLNTTLTRSLDTGSPLLLAKLVGADTLEGVARSLAALHRPADFDWAARFGLPSARRVAALAPAAALHGAPQVDATQSAVPQASASPLCLTCGVAVSNGIADYCLGRRNRFDGHVYCMGCQPKVRLSPRRAAIGQATSGPGSDQARA